MRKRKGIILIVVLMGLATVVVGLRTHDRQLDPPPIATQGKSLSTGTQWRAWALFHDLIQSVDRGLQRNGWQSNCDPSGFDLPGCRSNSHPFHASAQLRGDTLAPLNPTSMTYPDHAVMYNQPAATYFRSSAQNLMESPTGTTTAVSFPDDSIIFLPGWEVLRKGTSNSKLATAKIFDPGTYNPGQPILLQNQIIDSSKEDCPSVLTIGPIPIGCFYHITIVPTNFNFYRMESTSINIGDIMVLVGFHIIGKNDCSNTRRPKCLWTWSTFWWQRDPSNRVIGNYPCPSGIAVTCAGIDSPWDRYVMDAVELPSDPNALIRPVFNPYLDAQFKEFHGDQTNCNICHSFAAVSMIYGASTPGKFGQTPNLTTAQFNCLLQTSLANLRATDMIWTLEGRVDNPPGGMQTHASPTTQTQPMSQHL